MSQTTRQPSSPSTLAQKVWESHVVRQADGEPDLVYIDLHLVHEVTSPQAFDGLRAAGRRVRQPLRTVATVDHNIPTEPRGTPITDLIAAKQIAALQANCKKFGIRLFDLDSAEQGIVHVIGPELGLTQPGMTIVCGDSHTSTHGAFGALAFGIGTSEVEHVLATQCLVQSRPPTMEVHCTGQLQSGVYAKDLILALIRRIGTDGATGLVIEYTGCAIGALSMESRMTVCNMSIEAGARAGMIAPDEITFHYLHQRPRVPQHDAWRSALAEWRSLPSDPGAQYDRREVLEVDNIVPQVTWGTTPAMTVDITGRIPDPQSVGEGDRASLGRALAYMDLRPGMDVEGIPIDRVFLGSCTNARLEDLREAAQIVRGRQVANGV